MATKTVTTWRTHARAAILALVIVSASAAGIAGIRKAFAASPTPDQRDRGPIGVGREDADELAPLSRESVALLRRTLRTELAGIASSSRASIHVSDPGARETLFDRSGDRALVPASNMKSIVGAAALDLLGADYEFATIFRGTAPLDADGVLDGDLVVTGSGDPTISGRFFDGDARAAMSALAACLTDAGLRRVTGRIIADTSRFAGPATGPRWPDDPMWMSHMVEPSALVFNDNETRLALTRTGEKVEVRPAFAVGHVEVVNRVRGRGKHALRLDRGETDNRFVISGTTTETTSFVDANVHDGSLYFVRALERSLAVAGVPVGGAAAETADGVAGDLYPIFTYHSQLPATLEVMLQRSNNLYAELVLRAIAIEVAGKGSLEAGCRVVTDWLRRNGALIEGTIIRDGSGLSRANAVSARQLVAALEVARSNRGTFPVFRDSLARPGVGTLRKRMSKLAGSVFAKTGTMTRISSLGGYVRSREGRVLVFAAVFNDCDVGAARRAQDRLCAALHAVR